MALGWRAEGATTYLTMPDARLSDLTAAVASSAATQALARDLDALGIPLIVLKGAPVQQRLFGNDAAYRSADVDVLVPRRHGRQVRRHLASKGWRFIPQNGLLWRPDRAAAFEKRGVTLDLHWGLHAHMVSPRLLRYLERDLWEKAKKRSDEGWLEPRIEPLLVYLAFHAAAKNFGQPQALRMIAAAARQVEDWALVERVARRSRIWGSVRHAIDFAMGAPHTNRPSLLDGRLASARVVAASLFRGRLAPKGFRDAARKLRQRLG